MFLPVLISSKFKYSFNNKRGIHDNLQPNLNEHKQIDMDENAQTDFRSSTGLLDDHIQNFPKQNFANSSPSNFFEAPDKRTMRDFQEENDIAPPSEEYIKIVFSENIINTKDDKKTASNDESFQSVSTEDSHSTKQGKFDEVFDRKQKDVLEDKKSEGIIKENEGFQPGKQKMFEEQDALKMKADSEKNENISSDDLKPPAVHYANKGEEDEKSTFSKVLEGVQSVYEYTSIKVQEGAEVVKEGIQSVKESVVGKSDEDVPTRKEALDQGCKKMEEEGGRERKIKEEFHPDNVIPEHKEAESNEHWHIPQDKGSSGVYRP